MPNMLILLAASNNKNNQTTNNNATECTALECRDQRNDGACVKEFEMCERRGFFFKISNFISLIHFSNFFNCFFKFFHSKKTKKRKHNLQMHQRFFSNLSARVSRPISRQQDRSFECIWFVLGFWFCGFDAVRRTCWGFWHWFNLK